eukprot:10366699-Karenia_brevis.AAC.1
MVLSLVTMVGVYPTTSAPYVAAGQIPVLQSARALLLTLLNSAALSALLLAPFIQGCANSPPQR